ncbi:MAG: hypothetical protein LUG84_04730, partial [Akkermansiaceae bacterium]|nr:hypothetical protein [Akkermansiaceae bacterium]
KTELKQLFFKGKRFPELTADSKSAVHRLISAPAEHAGCRVPGKTEQGETTPAAPPAGKSEDGETLRGKKDGSASVPRLGVRRAGLLSLTP